MIKIMRYYAIILLCFVAITATAKERSGQPIAGFAKMTNMGNGVMALTFFMNEGKKPFSLVLYDNDGLATMIALHYMLIQDVANDVRYAGIKWEQFEKMAVKSWPKIKPAVEEALEKLANVYSFYIKNYATKLQQTVDKSSKNKYQFIIYDLEARVDELNEIKTQLLEKDKVTYLDLNILGAWLQDHGPTHVYTQRISKDKPFTAPIIDKNNENNPIGKTFGNMDFKLPGRLDGSRVPTILNGDVVKIVEKRNETPPKKGARKKTPVQKAKPVGGARAQ